MVKLFRIADAIHALGRRAATRQGEPSGVLLVSAGGLGDTILYSLVLPRFMELARDGERVAVLMRKDGAKTAFLFPPEVERIVVDFSTLRKDTAYRRKVMDELFEANFRLAVATDYLRHPDLDEALIAAAQAEEAAAMEPRPWPKHDKRLRRNRRLYGRLFDSGPPVRDKVLRWAAFADWLTGQDGPPPKVSLPVDRLPPPIEKTRPLVVVQPFSAVAEKQSPPELYERLLALAPEGAEVRITGAPGEIDRNPAFRRLLDRPNTTYDASTFEEILPALRAADLVISVDTAMMHLACAAGAPTLCLASAAYVDEIVPYAAETAPGNVRFVYHDMPCRSCLGDCRLPAEDGMYPCVARIDPELAEAAVRELLGTG